jgi:hypothetical protein
MCPVSTSLSHTSYAAVLIVDLKKFISKFGKASMIPHSRFER